MAHSGRSVAVDRDMLCSVLEELLDKRRLLSRVGSDLRTIARSAGDQVEQGVEVVVGEVPTRAHGLRIPHSSNMSTLGDVFG